MSIARKSSRAAAAAVAAGLGVAPSLIQATEAEVAVRLERSHAELLGEGEGLAVALLGPLEGRRLALELDRGEQPERVRLVAALAVLLREVEGLGGERERARRAGRPARCASARRASRSDWLALSFMAAARSTASSRSGSASPTRPRCVYAAPRADATKGHTRAMGSSGSRGRPRSRTAMARAKSPLVTHTFPRPAHPTTRLYPGSPVSAIRRASSPSRQPPRANSPRSARQ